MSLRTDGKAPGARPRARDGLAAFLVLAILAPLLACSQAVEHAALQPETVVLPGRFGSRAVMVEIADDPAEQAQGLMGRAHLAADRGMLFVYPDEAERHFWMHNTPISLDMIFLDRNLFIVGIIRRAKPNSDDTLTVGKPSRYVLEVEAGLCDRLGIREGDQVAFH